MGRSARCGVVMVLVRAGGGGVGEHHAWCREELIQRARRLRAGEGRRVSLCLDGTRNSPTDRDEAESTERTPRRNRNNSPQRHDRSCSIPRGSQMESQNRRGNQPQERRQPLSFSFSFPFSVLSTIILVSVTKARSTLPLCLAEVSIASVPSLAASSARRLAGTCRSASRSLLLPTRRQGI